MRHAATDSNAGDPPNFRLGDCSTQRNLSEAGRETARRVGARFRAQRVPIAEVFTSPWCRCRETAVLAFGKAEDWEPLSSTFAEPEREAEFSAHVLRRVGNYAKRNLDANVVMVTHNVNIAALTKLSVVPAEVVIVRPDGCCGLRVVTRIAPPVA